MMVDSSLQQKDEDKSEVWQKILKTALAIPGARINRAAFLRKSLYPHFPEDVVQKAIDMRPSQAGISPASIKSIAQASIAWHRAGVTSVSFATGIPGGWWMAGTVPADMAQFFWHIVVVLQKLAYLYGWPALAEEGQELDDETLHIFTLFAGVMFGVGTAGKALGELAEKIAAETAKRLPKMALTKWGVYKVAKEVAKWIGISLTKDTFAKWAAKAIPIISGFISGTMTWVTFSTMSKKLRLHLEDLHLARA